VSFVDVQFSRICQMAQMCPSFPACLSVRLVSPAQTAAPIEMPFELWTWVGPGNHVFDDVQVAHGTGFKGEGTARCKV